MSILIINGSNNDASRINGVAQYIHEAAAKQRIAVDEIVVHELPAEVLIHADYTSPAIHEANAKVAAAQTIVVLTPVYKAAYSGILKTYLDLIPQKGLVGKTVLPIAVGGSHHHLLVIDYALKPVLAAIGATNTTQGVYIVDKQIERTEDGFAIDEEMTKRLDEQLAQVQRLQIV
ncbi:MAG: NADPH-dependent FMN reductase [Caryophanon sp.]|nr:NADPH-dependent FMN reductase [Caryophanon sp.]